MKSARWTVISVGHREGPTSLPSPPKVGRGGHGSRSWSKGGELGRVESRGDEWRAYGGVPRARPEALSVYASQGARGWRPRSP